MPLKTRWQGCLPFCWDLKLNSLRSEMSNVKCFAEMLGTFEGIYSRGTFPYFDNKQRNFAKEVCEEVILHFASKLGLSLGQSWNVFKIIHLELFLGRLAWEVLAKRRCPSLCLKTWRGLSQNCQLPFPSKLTKLYSHYPSLPLPHCRLNCHRVKLGTISKLRTLEFFNVWL